jgi:hypothetical protein
MTLNLATAYPAEANIDTYTRSAELANGVITIEDDVVLKDDGKVMFSYLVRVKPEEVGHYGLLDTGTGSLDKVKVENGHLVNADCGDMYALCILGDKVYKVDGTVLTEVED